MGMYQFFAILNCLLGIAFGLPAGFVQFAVALGFGYAAWKAGEFDR